MALQTNSIGTFTFIALLGEWVPPSTLVMTEDRPGVDGTEFIYAGQKGKPFSLISQVDCASYAEGKLIFSNYLLTKAIEPLPVIQGGVLSISDFPAWRAKVVDVTLLRCMSISGAVGNKLGNAPNQGFLECRWDLVAVPI